MTITQGRRWFFGIIIAHLPEILLLRIIDYLEIIFPGIQVDGATNVAVIIGR